MLKGNNCRCFFGAIEEEEQSIQNQDDKAKKQKKVVCACTTVLDSNSVLGIYNVTTLKEHRKKGYAFQMLIECLKRAKETGAIDLVCLQSSQLGYQIYKRLGF